MTSLALPRTATATDPQNPAAGPGSSRIPELDVLRGFALIGVVLVNYTSPTLGAPGVFGPVDHRTAWFLEIFVHHKAYPLLSFLFGAGMALQLRKLHGRDTGFAVAYSCRLAVLFVIGVLHAIFVWFGDILHVYAIFGFILLLLRNAASGVLIPLAVVCIGVSRFAPEITSALGMPSPDHTALYGPAATVLYELSPYVDLCVSRLHNLVESLTHLRSYLATLDVLGMSLIGYVFGRARYLDNMRSHGRPLHRVFVVSAAMAICGMSYSTIARGTDSALLAQVVVTHALTMWKNYVLSLSYALGVVLLLSRGLFAVAAARLALIGRVSLTCYLLQSVIGVFVFYGAGLGLHAGLGVFTVACIAMCVYLVQMSVSSWWLERFRMGPAEWLWRAAAHGCAARLGRLAV